VQAACIKFWVSAIRKASSDGEIWASHNSPQGAKFLTSWSQLTTPYVKKKKILYAKIILIQLWMPEESHVRGIQGRIEPVTKNDIIIKWKNVCRVIERSG
jgi:hypothetical protein